MQQKFDTAWFISKASNTHGGIYDYSRVNYENAHRKVEIICTHHGIFLQTPGSHIYGRGCPNCATIRRNKKNTYSQEEFIRLAKNIFGDIYDYSEVVYVNSKTDVLVKCKKHGIFSIRPNNHIIQKQGCQKCGAISSANSRTKSANSFHSSAVLIHGDKYNYSKVQYVTRSSKVIIICPIHGEFMQTPSCHLLGYGCAKCGVDVGSVKNRNTVGEFIEKSVKLFGNIYSYSLVDYLNSQTPVAIICPKHGKFLMRPNNHLSGQGCPICKESRGERTIRLFLERHKIEFTSQKRFDDLKGSNSRYAKCLPFDFFIPSQNLLIEYDGLQHFEPVKQFGGHKEFKKLQKTDMLKNEYCKTHDILLVRIPHTVKGCEIDKLLESTLNIDTEV